jgi:hypothetical protein
MSIHIKDWTPQTKVVGHPGRPTILCRWCVTTECGCGVWIGIRADNQEPATAFVPCREDGHLAGAFQKLMLASLQVATDKRLVDVVAQMLGAAAERSVADHA